MATTPTIASDISAPADSLSAIDSAADARLAEFKAEVESAPAEAPSESPTPVEAKPEPATPADEASNAPKVEAPALTPQEKTARENLLAKFNGDEEAAAKWAWENNNRSAELARKVKELEEKLATGSNPEQAETLPETHAPQPAAPAFDLDAVVRQAVEQDAQSTQLVQEWSANTERLKALSSECDTHRNEVQTLQAWLKLDEIKNDEFRTSQIQGKLVIEEARLARAEAAVERIESRNERLNSAYVQRTSAFRDHFSRQVSEQQQTQQAQKEYDSNVARYATELEQAWKPTLSKVVQANNILGSLAPKFAKQVHVAAVAQLESGLRVEQLEAFMDSQAKEFLSTLDEYHRAQSGVYAAQAKARATQPAPIPSVAQVQADVNTGDPLAAIHEREERMWKEMGAQGIR